MGEDGVFYPAPAVQRPGVQHACDCPGEPTAVQGAEEDRGDQEGQPGEPPWGRLVDTRRAPSAGPGTRGTTRSPRRRTGRPVLARHPRGRNTSEAVTFRHDGSRHRQQEARSRSLPQRGESCSIGDQRRVAILRRCRRDLAHSGPPREGSIGHSGGVTTSYRSGAPSRGSGVVSVWRRSRMPVCWPHGAPGCFRKRPYTVGPCTPLRRTAPP